MRSKHAEAGSERDAGESNHAQAAFSTLDLHLQTGSFHKKLSVDGEPTGFVAKPPLRVRECPPERFRALGGVQVFHPPSSWSRGWASRQYPGKFRASRPRTFPWLGHPRCSRLAPRTFVHCTMKHCLEVLWKLLTRCICLVEYDQAIPGIFLPVNLASGLHRLTFRVLAYMAVLRHFVRRAAKPQSWRSRNQSNLTLERSNGQARIG